MSPARPKVPHVPPAPLIRDDDDVLSIRTVLWRIHRTEGEHVRGWSELRTFGPLPSMRYDPQASQIGDHSEGVLYAAMDLVTALAEVFQASRTIDVVSFAPRATAWIPTRPLSLLDLTGTWTLRNGAASSLAQAPRSTCRRWARVIHDTWPEMDGLWAPSTMTGRPIVVLWDTAGDSFPARPEFSRQLSTPVLLTVIRRVARTEIGYRVAE